MIRLPQNTILFKNAIDESVNKLQSNDSEEFKYNGRRMHATTKTVTVNDPNNPEKEKIFCVYVFFD